MKENIVAKGKIFELVQTTQPDGRVFEVARRAPGTRVIIHDEAAGKILLTREFRRELGEWDYRLPGGKVFDTLDTYEAFRASGEDIVDAAMTQAKNEALEEAGVEVDAFTFIGKSTLGATVEWDLYVFEATTWRMHENGQQLEADEAQDIAEAEFYDYEAVREMIMSGAMQEDRIAMVLLRWLEGRGK